MPRLRIQDRNDWTEVPIRSRSFVIGRSKDCDHYIDSGYISRRHCQIFYHNGEWSIQDFGSTLGTEVNGKVIQTTPLQFGDVIKLAGKIDAVFMADVQVANTETLRVVQPDVHREGERLQSMDGHAPHQTYHLQGNLISIGRDPENTIHLPTDTISSKHAEMTRESGTWVLRDLSSGNGTFVNDQKIHNHTLQPGDLIRFDHITFRYEDVHFKVDKHGTRLRGELLPDPEPQRSVSVSQMAFVPDTVLETPSQRIKRSPKNGGKLLLFLVILLTLGLLAGAGYSGWLLLQHFHPQTQEQPADPGTVP